MCRNLAQEMQFISTVLQKGRCESTQMPLLAGSNNENAIMVQQLPPEPVIFGQTPAMRDVRQKLERVAASNLSVLVSGESGTGKDIVARLLHLYSPWAAGPFVKVNCPAIPGTLLESELFGYELSLIHI